MSSTLLTFFLFSAKIPFMNFKIETHRNNTGITYIKVIDTDTSRWTGSAVKKGQSIYKLRKELEDELRNYE